MERLPGNELKKIHAALLAAFHTPEALAQMVRFGLNESLDVLVGSGGGLQYVTFRLLEWAEATGRGEELLRAAHKANPTSPALEGLTWPTQYAVERAGARPRTFFDEVARVDALARPKNGPRMKVSVILGAGIFERCLYALPEDKRRDPELVAAHPTTPTDAELDELVTCVLAPRRLANRRTLATIVYQGSSPDDAVAELADRHDIALQSFTTFRGLIDFTAYRARQRAQFEKDPHYAPARYVPQRMKWRVGRDLRTTEDALAEMREQLGAPRGRLLLVLGDFGTGKTFLMRQLALHLAEKEGPIPMMVNLRLLEKTHDLDVLLAQHLTQQGERVIDHDALRYMMEAGDVVLLFDGFDELALRVTLDRAAEHLSTLTQAVRGQCRVVVTSRTQHFRNADQSETVLAQRLGPVQHQTFALEKFDAPRIRRFLRDHLAHPLRPEVKPVAEARLNTEVTRRYKLLQDIKDLGGLAETPRMLGMILEIPVKDLQQVKKRAGTITAANLYERLLTHWLTYEWERANPSGVTPGLPVEARWRFVTRFAKRLWLQTDAGLPEEAVSDEVTAVVREMKLKIDPAVATHEAASSTLLCRVAEERHAFLHQSVLEYLVAREAVHIVKTPGEVGLLDEGELSVLMARFLIEQAGAGAVVRWAENVPAGAERARANATRLRTMIADEFVTVFDLHGQDLRGQDLSALKTKFARAKLNGCDLSGMSLRGFVLRGADLSEARLRGVDLSGADLRGADFSGADLTGAKLIGSNATGAQFERALLRRVSFVGAKVAAEVAERAVAIGGVSTAPTRITPFVTGAEEVIAVAFDPRGEFLAVAVENAVWVIEAETYAMVLVLGAHTSVVTSVAFSPDGTRLATGSGDQTARVWDVETGTSIATLQGHTARVTSVAFSPDGTRLVSGSNDTTARVWNVETGTSIAILLGHTHWVESVAFSPDGTRLATGSGGMTAHVWDVERGTSVAILQGHADRVTSVAFSPDGTCLATGSGDRTARVWDVETGTSIAILQGHTHAVTSVAFSPDGTYLATGSYDSTARVWDVEKGTSIAILQGHTNPVTSVAFSPDGMRLATGSYEFARVWDVEQGSTLATLQEHTNTTASVAFSPDGTRLATGSWDQTARVWDVETGTSIATLQEHADRVTSVAFNSDGTRLATGSWDQTARVWDVETGTALRTLQGHTREVTSAAFSPDGTRLATGSDDCTARVWDVEGGTSVAILQGHADRVTSVAFSPDGTCLATGSGDRTARVWDVETGTSIAILQGHTHAVTSVAFSPDGTRLATGSDDCTAWVWDVERGTSIAILQGHTGEVTSVAFSPDGMCLATAGDDTTARVWDVTQGTCFVTLHGHLNRVTSVAFSPDGRFLATSSYDGTARVWNLARAECLATLCAVGDGWVAFTPSGRYRMGGDLKGSFWHVVGLCRFEPGELDPYLNLRLRDDEPLLPAFSPPASARRLPSRR